jgi:hypothetical protein
MADKNKPNCFDCKHRGRVPGSAHSSCNHPANGKVNDDPVLKLAAILGSVGRTAPIQADTGLNVKGNPTGIRRGWFNWPFNYDPVWLESCDGFTAPNPASS